MSDPIGYDGRYVRELCIKCGMATPCSCNKEPAPKESAPDKGKYAELYGELDLLITRTWGSQDCRGPYRKPFIRNIISIARKYLLPATQEPRP